ncbi:MAG: hypothetical protein M1820_010328 [Bogoriella megaspora]|nr:MAG: hypothetical protein M1820_010328 [Bogoriella megaspora]
MAELPFLNRPPEIRTGIYRALLERRVEILKPRKCATIQKLSNVINQRRASRKHWDTHYLGGHCLAKPIENHTALSLALTCKQVYYEIVHEMVMHERVCFGFSEDGLPTSGSFSHVAYFLKTLSISDSTRFLANGPVIKLGKVIRDDLGAIIWQALPTVRSIVLELPLRRLKQPRKSPPYSLRPCLHTPQRTSQSKVKCMSVHELYVAHGDMEASGRATDMEWILNKECRPEGAPNGIWLCAVYSIEMELNGLCAWYVMSIGCHRPNIMREKRSCMQNFVDSGKNLLRLKN